MAHNNCVIVFDQNEYGTYFTGQTVSGKVTITLHKSKKLKGIKLQICGYASCQWRQKRGTAKPYIKSNPKARGKYIFLGREDYIASTTYLVGSEEGHSISLDPGTFTYTFACPIPFNCPSSFEGTFGSVRYVAKVTFIRSGASNRTHNVGFTVLKLLDLNQESRLLRAPANNESLENFCFLHTSPVNLKVDLMQTGYVPGQFILVSARVSNQSNVTCKKLIVALNLRATYTSDTPYMRTTTEKMCLVKKQCGPVACNSTRDFAETLRVPATPPTSEHLCKVVRVSYEICVVAVMSHLMANPKATIPITIGNVPLAMCGNDGAAKPDELPSTSARAVEPLGSAEETDDTDNDIDFGDDEGEGEPDMELPPPTYEEAMFMTTDIADQDVNTVSDSVQFTPRYPVFDVDSMSKAPGPPPNKPLKRRRRKKKSTDDTEKEKEKPPVESPVQI